MDKTQHAGSLPASTDIAENAVRQVYSAPQLTIYNPAELTQSGVTPYLSGEGAYYKPTS